MNEPSYSDWQMNAKPAAKRVYDDLLKTHGAQAGAAVEALEIARRRAELEQTEADWRKRHGYDLERARGNYGHKDYLAGGNLLASAGTLFKSLCGEFGPQRACHILVGIERESSRHQHSQNMKKWRSLHGLSVDESATKLGISSEDVEAIESNSLCAGPEAMRIIRPALRRIKSDLTDEILKNNL